MSKKSWPQGCVWPEPTENSGFWEAEDAESLPLDEDAEELLRIKEYMDELVSEGRLNPDYSLNEEFEDEEEDGGSEEAWRPDTGIDYWDDGFDLMLWEEDMASHLNLLKLPLPSPVSDIQQTIGYEFINENLLRQAFTRRAFALEYGSGDSENLELIGDSVLNTIVTREIARQLTEADVTNPSGPFRSSYHEGDLSKIRQHYICREYLSERAAELALDRYILYGSQEEPTESAREDMIEALLGAVAADCGWDWYTLEAVADKLLCVQVMNPDLFLKATHFELFNAWHQKKFGRMPEYEVSKGMPHRDGTVEYLCTLRFQIPENDRGVWTSQRVDVQDSTRSRAREHAAFEAYGFVMHHGLWMDLKDAGVEPKLEDAINQLQELYQKKYVEQPVYTFAENADGWRCDCLCGGVNGYGRAQGKTAAKKKAAFMVLVRLMLAAGICKDEWKNEMLRQMSSE